MTIAFSKRGNKENTITCTRGDGSQTWMQVSDFFIVHDLIHYAVETVLNFKNAFYGMLNSGINISDFEKPKDQRTIILTEEAIYAEHLVNLFSIEYSQGPFPDFNETLSASVKENNPQLTVPELSTDQIAAIRTCYNKIDEWFLLPEGESLTLTFN